MNTTSISNVFTARWIAFFVDAPCSGTGTYRRNPDLKWRFGEEELNRINDIQKVGPAQRSKDAETGRSFGLFHLFYFEARESGCD